MMQMCKCVRKLNQQGKDRQTSQGLDKVLQLLGKEQDRAARNPAEQFCSAQGIRQGTGQGIALYTDRAPGKAGGRGKVPQGKARQPHNEVSIDQEGKQAGRDVVSSIKKSRRGHRFAVRVCMCCACVLWEKVEEIRETQEKKKKKE